MILEDASKIKVRDADRNIVFEGSFSEAISMGDYRITVEKCTPVIEVGDEIRVSLKSYESATTGFHKQLNVGLLEKNASAVQISLKEANPDKGKDFLYTMIRKYNENGIGDKQLVSEKNGGIY